MLPDYLAIGMSAEEFWHGDVRLAESYREAMKIRRDNKLYDEWRQGVYVLEALVTASPAFREFGKGVEHDYPSEPIFSSPERRKEIEEEKEKVQMEKMLAKFGARVVDINQSIKEGA